MPASWSSFLRKQDSRLFLSPVRRSCLSLVIPAEARLQAVPVACPSFLPLARHSCGSRNPGCSCRPSVMPASRSSFLLLGRHSCFLVVIPAEAGIQAVLVARPSFLPLACHSCGSKNPSRPCLLPVMPASWSSFLRKQESRLFLSPGRHACFVVVMPAHAGIQAVPVACPSFLPPARPSCARGHPPRPRRPSVIPAHAGIHPPRRPPVIPPKSHTPGFTPVAGLPLSPGERGRGEGGSVPGLPQRQASRPVDIPRKPCPPSP